MSLHLKEILHELASVSGRSEQLGQDIDALPNAEERGETQREKDERNTELSADEKETLAKLQARDKPADDNEADNATE